MENVNGQENDGPGTLNFLMDKHLTSHDDKLLHAIADSQAHTGEGLSPGYTADPEATEIIQRDREATQRLISATIIRAEMAQKFRSTFVPGDERFDGHGGNAQKLRRIATQLSKIGEAKRNVEKQCADSEQIAKKRAQLEEEQNQCDVTESQQMSAKINRDQHLFRCAEKVLVADDNFSPEMLNEVRAARYPPEDPNSDEQGRPQQ